MKIYEETFTWNENLYFGCDSLHILSQNFFFVNLTLSVVHTGTREGATVKIKNMETTEQKLSFFLKTESEQISFSETYNEFMVWKSLKNFIFAIIAQKIIFHRVE